MKTLIKTYLKKRAQRKVEYIHSRLLQLDYEEALGAAPFYHKEKAALLKSLRRYETTV